MWSLFATCSSGLCNRLLMLAGAMRIAARTGRKLALYWPVNEDLGCAFNDLFQNTFPMITEADLKELLHTAFTVKVYNAWKTSGPIFKGIDANGDPETNILVIKGWSYPKFDDENYGEKLTGEIRHNLLSLVPLPEIQARVESFPLPTRSIGVHIRRGDNLEEFGKSKDEYFMNLMHALLKRQPEQRFFLATDVAQTEDRFRDEFGDRLLSLPKTWPGRHELAGVREGLIDLLLLSRTSAILGNTQSSFAPTAGKLGAKHVIEVDENSAVTRRDETCAFLLDCARKD